MKSRFGAAKLKYQTADGKILTQGDADEMDVGFAHAGLIIIGDKLYSTEDAERFVKRIKIAVSDSKAWEASAANAAKKQ